MDIKECVTYLKSPTAIRTQCERLYALAEADQLAHFRVRPELIPDAANYVLGVIRENYPTLDVPYHSRWRHFDSGRLAKLEAALKDLDADEQARIKFELAIVSVLLDAGAGDKWSWKDASSGRTLSKSEGLAAASFDMYMAGGFSSDPEVPLRVDPVALKALRKAELATYFQAGPGNPLAGLDGRVALLGKLGEAIRTLKLYFGDQDPRLGGLYDYLVTQSGNLKLPARKILTAVLDALGGIWPGRVSLGGVSLGDVWRHSQLPEDDLGRGLVPFHKLSQWLTYSLVEPLIDAGIDVHGIEELTGLAEYRNGGLFLDLGVLVPKHDEVLRGAHKPDSEIIVEWRAMTVALLDRIGDTIRASLGLDAEALPLAKVLEGGSWAAGRKVAREKRPDGGPPINVVSDGTVF